MEQIFKRHAMTLHGLMETHQMTSRAIIQQVIHLQEGLLQVATLLCH